jgi:hypothetical protein
VFISNTLNVARRLVVILLVIFTAVAVYEWLVFAGGMRAGVVSPFSESFLPLHSRHNDAPRQNSN